MSKWSQGFSWQGFGRCMIKFTIPLIPQLWTCKGYIILPSPRLLWHNTNYNEQYCVLLQVPIVSITMISHAHSLLRFSMLVTVFQWVCCPFRGSYSYLSFVSLHFLFVRLDYEARNKKKEEKELKIMEYLNSQAKTQSAWTEHLWRLPIIWHEVKNLLVKAESYK